MTERKPEVHEAHVHDGHESHGPSYATPIIVAIVAILAIVVALMIALSVAGNRGGGDSDLPQPNQIEPGGGRGESS